ncbi:MAG: SdpI family protein [Clostridia bacterium]|nr:SdpI family protein [Clostridia bacterium]
MIKNNKFKIIISSVIILLPIIAGLLLWNKLPDKIATHFGIDGTADGFSSKPFAIFFLPLFVFAVHWICIFATTFDKKNRTQNKKAMNLVFWICPVISVLVSAAMYSHGLGYEFNISAIAIILMSLMFIIIGNYMPKIKQNSTLGVKVPWTLRSEKNWNATHRFCGKVWVIGGITLMLCVFLPQFLLPCVLLILLPIIVIIPIIYSYMYHKKHEK